MLDSSVIEMSDEQTKKAAISISVMRFGA